MTFRRFVNRNNLNEGDYENLPSFKPSANRNPISPVDGSDHSATLLPFLVKDLERYEDQLRMICGDLRRLEVDVQDEGHICQVIAERTGVDVDTVAVVLKEFMVF